MDKNQLRELIKETLVEIGFYSQSSYNLVTATVAVESDGGRYIHQIVGPAVGIGQMEPATFNWLMDNYLSQRVDVRQRIQRVCNIEDFHVYALAYNMKFSIAMTRVRYLAEDEPLPAHDDIDGMWRYYKLYYNSVLGATTEEQFKRYYKNYVS